MPELHPEMRKLIDTFEDLLKEAGLNSFKHDDPNVVRSFLKQAVFDEESLPSIHRVEARSIPGPGGDLPIRIYRPNDSENLPVLMWFHGGGWVMGDLDTGEGNCRDFANALNCVVVAPDYRLAPETPFPGAIDDCQAATRWVVDNAVELNVDVSRLAIGGDSAGGNLAAGVALRSRDEGLRLCFQFLVYPVVDADFEVSSYVDNANGYLLSRSDMQWFWDCYVPNVEDRKNPWVAPLHSADLSGLPPAHVISAEFDPLRDEAEKYADALRTAGNEVECFRYDGMIHAFFNFKGDVPVEPVETCWRRGIEAIKKAFSAS